jgi:hypothetical protein
MLAERMVAVSYTVTAKRWKGGWELHIDGEGVTQSRTLAVAEQAVRDYIATLHDLDEVTDDITIVPELDQATKAKIRKVRERQREVERVQREVAADARRVVRELRSRGLSVTDVAAVLDVSRGRVSQLAADTAPTGKLEGRGKSAVRRSATH